MAMRCEICGKGAQIGHNVSFSKRRTRRVFLPNLRWAKIGGKKVKICMRCLKKAKKEGKVEKIKALKRQDKPVPPKSPAPQSA